MLKNTIDININTILNIFIAAMLGFFGYVSMQYEKRFDMLQLDIKENREVIDRRFDQVISLINDNKIQLSKLSERQNYIDKRVVRLENFK